MRGGMQLKTEHSIEPAVWYPVVLAFYPPLTLYAANVQEVLLTEAIGPLLSCVAFAAAL